jgi:dTDP-4-dehydrorhamnose reductase
MSIQKSWTCLLYDSEKGGKNGGGRDIDITKDEKMYKISYQQPDIIIYCAEYTYIVNNVPTILN